MKSFGRIVAAALLLGGIGTGTAYADACSGRNHDTGTALGAVGGAAIGGLASNSIGGAIIGGVAGGFAGNAIARSNDCNKRRAAVSRTRHSYVDRNGRRHYYYR